MQSSLISSTTPRFIDGFFRFIPFPRCQEKLTEIFLEHVQPLYGDQSYNLKEFVTGEKRRCEVAVRHGAFYGAIAYMHNLKGAEIFEVRNLLLLKEKYEDENHSLGLLKRITELAMERKAASVQFFIPAADEGLIEFLKTKHFTKTGEDTISTQKKEAVIFSSSIELLKEQFEWQKSPPPQEQEVNRLGKRGATTREHQLEEPSLKRRHTAIEDRPRQPIQFPSSNRRHSTGGDVLRQLTLRKIYIHQIRDGLKTVEGRISTTVGRYNEGDRIRFYYQCNPQDDVVCRITKIQKFSSFKEMLLSCGYRNCVPNERSFEAAVRAYDAIPGYTEKAKRHGVAAVHLKVIPKY